MSSKSFFARWFPALQEAAVRRYFTGQIVSTLGTWIQVITLNLLAWDLTRSPAILGALNFLLFGPVAVLAPLVGARIHSDNARRVTLYAVAGAVGISIALVALQAANALSLNLIVIVAAASGILFGVELPARQVLLACCVRERQRIGNAISMNTLATNGARMVGPAIAAMLFPVFGAGPGFIISGIASLFMFTCVLSPSLAPAVAPGAPAAARPGLRAALAYARADRIASLFLPVLASVAILAGSFHTLVPVLADHVFGDANRWTGVFFTTSGIGALAAALILSSSHAGVATRHLGVLMPWAVALALAGLGTSASPTVALPCFLVIGFGLAFIGPGTNAMLQQHAPPPLRGALAGLYLLCQIGLLPVGYLMVGLVAQKLPVQPTFLALAAALAACLLLIFVPRWRAHGRVELNGEKI